MIEVLDYKLLHWGPLEWHYLHTKFHENLSSRSEVISGGHRQTDRQTGDLISILSFFKSRLNIYVSANYNYLKYLLCFLYLMAIFKAFCH
jgi:hypothetical protein